MPDPNWNRADGDERPMKFRSYWIALPTDTVAVGFYGSGDGAEHPDDPLAKTMWRYVSDQCPVDPPPTHWAEIDVPAHPGVTDA